MDISEVLTYDAIWWQRFDMERQMHAFDKVPRIRVLRIESNAVTGLV